MATRAAVMKVRRGMKLWKPSTNGTAAPIDTERAQIGVVRERAGRYQRFQRRIRDHVKNEINRVINHLVDLYRPKTAVVEKLDFQSGDRTDKSVVGLQWV